MSHDFASLSSLLSHPRAEVRAWAADRLFRLWPKEAIPLAWDLLRGPPADPVVVAAAAEHLAEEGQEEWREAVVERLGRVDEGEQACLGTLLAQYGDPRGRDALVQALQSSASAVSLTALTGLGFMEGCPEEWAGARIGSLSKMELLDFGPLLLQAGGAGASLALLHRWGHQKEEEEEVEDLADLVMGDATGTSEWELLPGAEGVDFLEVKQVLGLLAAAMFRPGFASLSLPVARVTCDKSLNLLVDFAMESSAPLHPTPQDRAARATLLAWREFKAMGDLTPESQAMLRGRLALCALAVLAPLSGWMDHADWSPSRLLDAFTSSVPEFPPSFHRVIRNIPDAMALPFLREATSSNHTPWVGRARALLELGERWDLHSLDTLLTALLSMNTNVAYSACRALSLWGATGAEAVLSRFFRSEHLPSDWPLEVLAAIPNENAHSVLMKRIPKKGTGPFRTALMRALALQGNPASAPLLKGTRHLLRGDREFADAVGIWAAVTGDAVLLAHVDAVRAEEE